MIYVTGGTGLLGSHLLVNLAVQNVSIRAIYRSKSKLDQTRKLFSYYLGEKGNSHFDQIDWVQGDILDIPFLTDSMQGCTKVYHCAALVSFHQDDFQQLIKLNREGTGNIVNVCLDLGIEKLCYVSSTAAVGSSTHFGKLSGDSSETSSAKLITEKTPWKNTPTTTGYSISKYNAEREVWRGIEEGLNAVMVNPCVILGAGNWNDSSLTIFRTLKKGMTYYPPGSNSIVDARDVAEIMIRLMESDIHSERFLCIGSNQSFFELMSKISMQLGVKAPSKEAPRFLVNVVRRMAGFISIFTRKKPSITKETVQSLFGERSYSSEKVKSALDFEFRSLEDTIENSIAGRIN